MKTKKRVKKKEKKKKNPLLHPKKGFAEIAFSLLIRTSYVFQFSESFSSFFFSLFLSLPQCLLLFFHIFSFSLSALDPLCFFIFSALRDWTWFLYLPSASLQSSPISLFFSFYFSFLPFFFCLSFCFRIIANYRSQRDWKQSPLSSSSLFRL